MYLRHVAVVATICAFLVLLALSALSWRSRQDSQPWCEMTYNYNGYVAQSSPMLPTDAGYELKLYREGHTKYGEAMVAEGGLDGACACMDACSLKCPSRGRLPALVADCTFRAFP